MIESLSKRTDYPSLLDYTYLNQASLGLIGTPAVEAMNDFLYNVARHGNLKMSDEQEVNFLNQLKRNIAKLLNACLLYTSPSPRDGLLSRMPSSA